MKHIFGESRRYPGVRRARAARPFGIVATLLLLAAAVAAAGCAPTGTGQATPTVDAAAAQQQLDAAARQAVSGITQQVQATFDAKGDAVEVTATVGWTADITIADVDKEQARAKTIIFQVQRALWTSGVPLRAARVIVIGPVLSEYGDQETGAHAVAELAAATAAKLSWGALTPDAAWERYDHVFLRISYVYEA